MPRIYCTPRSLSATALARAARRAVSINPANAARFSLGLPDRRGGMRRIVVVQQFKWPASGVRLSVQFLDNPPKDLRARILAHMNAWSQTANVTFVETRQAGKVRIARSDDPALAGYWSLLGTQILEEKPNLPTMNLQAFTMRTSESEFRRVVRHEAGHTLGFHHEHMRSAVVRKIDPEKAYRYFRSVAGWSKADVDSQVLRPLVEASLMGTSESDPTSIMCYQLPASIMRDGKEVPGGTDINATDYGFAGELYPKKTARRAKRKIAVGFGGTRLSSPKKHRGVRKAKSRTMPKKKGRAESGFESAPPPPEFLPYVPFGDHPHLPGEFDARREMWRRRGTLGEPGRVSHGLPRVRSIEEAAPTTTAPTAEAGREVHRTPHMDVGDQPKAPGEKFTVTVYANQAAARTGEDTSDIVVNVPSDLDFIDVEVWLTGTEHFGFSADESKIRVPVASDEQSTKVTFEVMIRVDVSAVSGDDEPRLTAYFSYHGRPSGKVSREIAITIEQPRRAATHPKRSRPAMAVNVGAKLADLTIHVTKPRESDHPFDVKVTSPHLPGFSSKAITWDLPNETEAYVESHMKEFTSATSPAAAIDALKAAGGIFWTKAPFNVKDAYWELIDRKLPLRTILVVSEEPNFPWELLRPSRDGRPRKQLHDALGITYDIGRWISDASLSPPQVVRLSSSLVVAPRYNNFLMDDGKVLENLRHAQKEATFVGKQVHGTRLKPVDYEGFKDAVRKNDYDLLHMACHGAAKPAPGIQTIHLEKGATLSSAQLMVMNEDQQHGLGRGPLVFLNCCETARLTPSLVGLCGFAPAFITSQASAVIAPMWAVKDDFAHKVCLDFYRGLTDSGKTLACLLKEIRAKAYDPAIGEDTYAAYTFYGDPCAVVQR
jgi:hypothetical protein